MAYSAEERDTFLNEAKSLMEAGNSLRAACKTIGVPHSTILSWILQDDQEGGNLSDQFARARNELRTVIADDIIGIADQADDDPASRRVRVDARLKVLARLAPKRWGERVTNENVGQDGGPMQFMVVTGVDRQDD
jgi:hypothetical protein